jgi:hypothetical protein
MTLLDVNPASLSMISIKSLVKQTAGSVEISEPDLALNLALVAMHSAKQLHVPLIFISKPTAVETQLPPMLPQDTQLPHGNFMHPLSTIQLQLSVLQEMDIALVLYTLTGT